MKNLLKSVVSISTIFMVAFLPFATLTPTALAGGEYSITGSATVTGFNISLNGIASANPYVGKLDQQHVAVDWGKNGDSIANNWNRLDYPYFNIISSSTDPKMFDSTWASSTTYLAPGNYNLFVLVYHGNEPGAESGSATIRIDVTVPNYCGDGKLDSGEQCDDSNQISGDGCSSTCRIEQPFLTVIKHVINNNGGTKTASDFSIAVTGNNPSPASFNGQESPGTNVLLNAGPYNITEAEISGYAVSYSADCSGTISTDQTKTCTITNDDQSGTLIVKKVITNDNGGTKTYTDFSFQVDNGAPVAFEEDSQNDLTINAGTYSITEPVVTGYSTTYDNCLNVVIPNGGSATCTITNNDIQPQLTVVKHVVGGPLLASDFTINIEGTNVSNSSFAGSEAPGTTVTLDAGSYSVTESSTAGDSDKYTSSASDNCSGTIAIGENKTCVITNAYPTTATLTVIKTVINNNGGVLNPSDFVIHVTQGGQDVANSPQNGSESGTVYTLDPNTYAISENVVSGYGSSFSGDCPNGNVNIVAGESYTCTITNDDIVPTLTLVKAVTNDNGGTAVAADWTLTATGPVTISGAGGVTSDSTFKAGTYTLSEEKTNTEFTITNGYTPSDWVCVEGEQNGNTITIGLDEGVTCTITNSDIQPKLTVTKEVINNDQGTKVIADFPLFVDQTSVTSGVENGFNAGTYTVSETQQEGYVATFSGDCNKNGSITLNVGDVKSCTITNNDISPTQGSLTVTKIVTNDNGGTATTTDFHLFVGGIEVANGQAMDFATGTYTISETGLTTGYAATFSGACDSNGQITVVAGSSTECTITNDDIVPQLTVIKHVATGTAQASEFTINVAGDNVSSSSFPGNEQGTIITLNAGQYSVTEATATNYSVLYDNCSGTIGIGDTKTCTITNTYVPPVVLGCTDQIATNFNPNANQNNGSCTYPQPLVPPSGGSGGGGGGGPIFLNIFNETNGDITTVTAVVGWFTNILATSRVVYDIVPHYYDFGTAPNYGYAFSTPEDSNKVTFHTVVITGLTPGITYYWRAISHGSGEIWGQELVFTTIVLSQPLPPEEETGGGVAAETGGTEGGTGAGTETGGTAGETGVTGGTEEETQPSLETGTGGAAGEEKGEEAAVGTNAFLAAIGSFFNLENIGFLLIILAVILIFLFFIFKKRKKKKEQI